MSEAPHPPATVTVTISVDPERTRQIQVSLPRLRAIVASAAVVLVAATAGVVWLVARAGFDSAVSRLDAQTKGGEAIADGAEALAVATAARAGIAAGATAPAEDAAWASADGATTVATTVEGKLLAAAEPKALSDTVGITTPTFEYAQGVFRTKFSVMNNGTDEVQGTVWGVATFETDAGETLSVPSHPNLDLSALDDMRHVEQGTNYKARRLTNKALSFAVPADKSGRFVEVRIAVGERSRAQLVVATFALEAAQ